LGGPGETAVGSDRAHDRYTGRTERLTTVEHRELPTFFATAVCINCTTTSAVH
jgi:hypothetical protein